MLQLSSIGSNSAGGRPQDTQYRFRQLPISSDHLCARFVRFIPTELMESHVTDGKMAQPSGVWHGGPSPPGWQSKIKALALVVY